MEDPSAVIDIKIKKLDLGSYSQTLHQFEKIENTMRDYLIIGSGKIT